MKSYSQAFKILKKGKIRINNEIVRTSKSLNRVSASDVYSNEDYPSQNNSSLDGYAINASDTKNIKKNKPKAFKIIGCISAGTRPFIKKNKKFDTVEIMTGGIIPKNFDAIIPIEKVNSYQNEKMQKFIMIKKKN